MHDSSRRIEAGDFREHGDAVLARIRAKSDEGRDSEWFAVAWVRHGQLRRLNEYRRERDAHRALRQAESA